MFKTVSFFYHTINSKLLILPSGTQVRLFNRTRILINESLLRLKKRKNPIHLNDDTMNKDIYQQHAIDKPTPVSTTLNSGLKTILEKSIRHLPEKYRTVSVMREII